MNDIRSRLGLPVTAGDVGIEIEVEAKSSLPTEKLPKPWRAETDGSLRGFSMEYITRTPIDISEVDAVVKALYAHIKGSGIYDSFRAGVHVHINAQSLSLPQVANVAAVYYCLEDILLEYCGESRSGNHFCLRAKDAYYPVESLMSALSNNDIGYFATDNLRYASLNLRALTRYGSLEFRGMGTTPDFSKISDWCNMLHNIKVYGENLKRRSDIAFDISSYGPENWAQSVLGKDLFNLLPQKDFDRKVMSCLRLVQPLLHT